MSAEPGGERPLTPSITIQPYPRAVIKQLRGSSGPSRQDIESIDEVVEDETPTQESNSPFQTSQMPVKEVLSARATNYLLKGKNSENALAHITFSLSMGSIWRFPYLCHRNGPGNFILVYIFLLLLLGVPLLYLEQLMAHWRYSSSIQTWKQLVPSLGGIGYASTLISLFLSSYNSIIVTWNLFYLINSFKYPLPWEHCSLGSNSTAPDLSCLQTVSPHYFWYQTTLNSLDYTKPGVYILVLHLLLLSMAVWVIVILLMTFEVNHSVVTQAFSLFILLFLLFCFLVWGFYMENAISGLRSMVTTKVAWFSMDLWRQAGGHVLYTLGLGLSLGAISNPNYNSMDNSSFWMAFSLALVNLAVSLLATAIVFIILDFWVTSSGQACVLNSVAILKQLISKQLLPENTLPPESVLTGPPAGYIEWVHSLPWPLQRQVVLSAPSCSIKMLKKKFLDCPSLAFVAFSQATSLQKGSNLWAILFFLSQFLMGLNCLKRTLTSATFSLQATISGPPQYCKVFIVIICSGGFVCCLFYASQAGSFIFSLFDDYLVPLNLMLIVLFQTVTLTCLYGLHRFQERLFIDMGLMLWPSFTRLCSYVTLPLLVLLTLLSFINLSKTPNYTVWNTTLSEEVQYPHSLRTWGWVFYISSLIFLPIPGYLCYHHLLWPMVHPAGTQQSAACKTLPLPKIMTTTTTSSLNTCQKASNRSLWRLRKKHSWTFPKGSFVKGKGSPNSLELPPGSVFHSSSYSTIYPYYSVRGSLERTTETASSQVTSEEPYGETLTVPRDHISRSPPSPKYLSAEHHLQRHKKRRKKRFLFNKTP